MEKEIDNKQEDLNPTPEEVLNFIANNQEAEAGKPKEEHIPLTQEDLEKIDLEALNPDKAPEPAPRIQIHPDNFVVKPFDSANKNLTDLSKVTISDEEKEAYVRCMLQDTPFSTTLSFSKLGIKVGLSSKTVGEQKQLSEFVKEYALRKNPNGELMYTTAEVMEVYLKLCVLMTVDSLNGQPFATEAKSNPDMDEKLKTFEGMPINKWFILLNAVRIFEQKEALLNEFMLNEDF